MSTSSATEEAPWQAGLHSARTLLRPGLVLQAAALGLVLAYYFQPSAQTGFAQLAAWSRNGGYGFSALTTALCGGVLPFLFLRLNPATRGGYPWPHLVFFTLFWAWKGAETDLIYHTLTAVYGGDAHAGTILRKVATDQFFLNPLYATPVGSIMFAWKDGGFRWAPVWADLRAGRWYARRCLPVQLSVWALWLPVVCCIYALPSPLQMPLFNVVLCFWSMLFAMITARQNHARS